MRRCEDEQMRRCEDVKMRRCKDVKMWRWEDVKMRRCEDEEMWRCEDVKMSRCEDVRMWRYEDEQMWGWEDVKMWRCEDEKMRCRPPLLEEHCAQTLSGKNDINIYHWHIDNDVNVYKSSRSTCHVFTFTTRKQKWKTWGPVFLEICSRKGPSNDRWAHRKQKWTTHIYCVYNLKLLKWKYLRFIYHISICHETLCRFEYSIHT